MTTRVLITGASGFLGSHVVDACLEAGYQVRVVARKSSDTSYLQTLLDRIEILKGDCNDAAFLEASLMGVDAVVHSAARVTDTGARKFFMEANVDFTRTLLEQSKNAGVKRFVFVSSPSVVAELRDQVKINEDYPYPLRPLNYYCETKAIAERMVLAANSADMTTCALRPRGIWGPRDTSGPFAKITKKMNEGRLKRVNVGRPVYSSMCYVKNAAKACVNAITAPNAAGNAYFITDAEPVELWAFADRLANELGIPPPRGEVSIGLVMKLCHVFEWLWKISYLRNNVPPPLSYYSAGLISYTATYDISRARRDLGYSPDISLEEGLANYKRWIDECGGMQTYLASLPK